MRKFLFHVGGKPFFTVGGQFHNSSSYSDEMMERGWKAAEIMGLNTVAVPVCWYQIEPQEGTYDFTVVDRIVNGARARGMHAVLLWFGTWKNGTSHYVPTWVKTQEERFALAIDQAGHPIASLSPHCEATKEADKKAFCKMMEYLKTVNEDETVIGVQLENEPGLNACTRDYSEAANAAYAEAVPERIASWVKNVEDCPIKRFWQEQGCPENGSWGEMFGAVRGPEIFTANAISLYIDEIAEAAREIYDIVIYVNVWLEQNNSRMAGIDYPSGGAVSSMIDLWKFNTPHIDCIAPDVYIQDADTYRAVCAAYDRPDNPLYIPESAASFMNTLNVPYQIANGHLCGIHVFGIESSIDENFVLKPQRGKDYARSVDIYKAMAPIIEMTEEKDIPIYAVGQYEGAVDAIIDTGDYHCYVNYFGTNSKGFDNLDHYHRNPETFNVRGKGLIAYLGNGEFYLAGEGFSVIPVRKSSAEYMTGASVGNFFLHSRSIRYLTIEEGKFNEEGTFIPKRYRCGDESDFGLWTHHDIGLVHAILR